MTDIPIYTPADVETFMACIDRGCKCHKSAWTNQAMLRALVTIKALAMQINKDDWKSALNSIVQNERKD